MFNLRKKIREIKNHKHQVHETAYRDMLVDRSYRSVNPDLKKAMSENMFDVQALRVAEEIGTYMQARMDKGESLSPVMFQEAFDNASKYSPVLTGASVRNAGLKNVEWALVMTWAHGKDLLQTLHPQGQKDYVASICENRSYEEIISAERRRYALNRSEPARTPETRDF